MAEILHHFQTKGTIACWYKPLLVFAGQSFEGFLGGVHQYGLADGLCKEQMPTPRTRRLQQLKARGPNMPDRPHGWTRSCGIVALGFAVLPAGLACGLISLSITRIHLKFTFALPLTCFGNRSPLSALSPTTQSEDTSVSGGAIDYDLFGLVKLIDCPKIHFCWI